MDRVAGRVDRQLLARRWRQNRSPDLFICPPAVADYLAAYVTQRGGAHDTIVDLWPGSGLLLPAVARPLQPTRAIGVSSDLRLPARARALHPEEEIEWWRGSPADFLDTTRSHLDVVIGVPPWGWRPRELTVDGVDGPVALTEDPSVASILRACMRLSTDGVGLFVLSPGFLLRPGPGTAMPNLSKFGLFVESVTTLPRGMFSPDSGTGRTLVALRRRPMREVLVGCLGSDREAASGLPQGLKELRPNS